MRSESEKRSLRRKILVLACGIGLLALLIFYQPYLRGKEKEAYKEMKKQEEQAEPAGEQQELPDTEQDEPEEETDIKTEAEIPEKQGAYITNLDEFATEVMGKNTYLLQESFSKWIEEKKINAVSGHIFHVMIPESDPQSINYYIRIEDEKGSLVMLAYHPRENVVTASICKYTEEEIKNEVWEDNGPQQRDVPAEAENLNEEEADEPGGEN